MPVPINVGGILAFSIIRLGIRACRFFKRVECWENVNAKSAIEKRPKRILNHEEKNPASGRGKGARAEAEISRLENYG
jgi:hypothetical protein